MGKLGFLTFLPPNQNRGTNEELVINGLWKQLDYFGFLLKSVMLYRSIRCIDTLFLLENCQRQTR